jgi:hypothetical protein
MTGFEVPGEKYTVITTPLVTNSGANDVFIAEDRYAVMTTGSGVDVVDLYCGLVISSGTIPGTETTCVSVDDTTTFGNIYIGTTTSGVYSTTWKPLRGGGDFSDQLVQRFSTLTIPSISDDAIRDLCARPFRLLISTGLGVDFIVDQGHTLLRSTQPLISGSAGCFLTTSMGGYWIATNSGVEASYDLNSSSGTGIIIVDFLYDSSTIPSLPTQIVNDLSVVSGTYNLLGFATTGGDKIVEERQGAEASSPAKSEYTSESVVSIDFSKEASFTTGTVYLATADSVRVFDLDGDGVAGTHFHTILEEEKHDKENTRDQALVTGTPTVIRTTGVA